MNLPMLPDPKKVSIARWSELADRQPAYACIADVDLVVVRWDDQVSVLYGRCLHRGALMADATVAGNDLICGLHQWDYRLDTGVSAYDNKEALERFTSWVDTEADQVLVDENEIAAWAEVHPQPYARSEYLGVYADTHGTPEEPYTRHIQELARNGLTRLGHHGVVSAMGVALTELPRWADIQIITAQLARQPLLDDVPVASEVVIGPRAKKPLRLEIPIFVSDMSFGALSEEAKVALAIGADKVGTGICSGEGGMLPEEQAANARYFYELASGRFGWSLDKVKRCQAFHFKGGQGAKTGTGGHLPGNKVMGKIAQVRGLKEGEPAISPSTFPDLHGLADFRRVAQEVREVTGGIPIGFKLSAQHIEDDIDFAVDAGADYIILDGRGGATRARRHLDRGGHGDITLVVTGGLRTESDFAKALALGADAIAISNSALQAIGCLGMRACHTNNCPVGIATQRPQLRARLDVQRSAQQLANYLGATVDLMKILARACGHDHLRKLCPNDLTSWKREVADLAGIAYAGAGRV